MVLFFDIDDTLVNQRRAEAIAATHFVRHFRHVLIDGANVARFCLRWRTARNRHLPSYLLRNASYQEYHRRRLRDVCVDGHAIDNPQADARYAAYLSFYRRAWCLHDDVEPALDMLDGIRLGVISNGNDRLQRMK